MTILLRPGCVLTGPDDAAVTAFCLDFTVRELAQRRPLPAHVAAQIARLIADFSSAAAEARFAAETTVAARVAAKAQAGGGTRITAGFAAETAAGIPSAATASLGATVGDAAKGLGVSTQSVRRLCRAGELVAQRHGAAWVIDPNSLASLIHRREAK